MIDGGTAHRPQKTESCPIIFLAVKEKRGPILLTARYCCFIPVKRLRSYQLFDMGQAVRGVKKQLFGGPKTVSEYMPANTTIVKPDCTTTTGGSMIHLLVDI